MSAGREGDGEDRRQFGAYELVRKLGRGGMAETFEAVRRGSGGMAQRVCVKRILPMFDGDTEFLELFRREAKISATLRHVNVAQVLDFGDVDGRHFLVLELVDGVDLRTLLRKLMDDGKRLPGGMLGYIAVELTQALDYAHAATDDGTIRGVVHRDVSPSNVLLAPSGDVKLTDFGVAKAMNAPSLTRTGGVKGKIPYMAPEYARGGVCDARSDLFSLGVMLYECAAGRRPFDGANEVETLERMHAGRAVPLRDVAADDVDPVLVEAIEALIQRDPAARPANATALLERLPAPPTSARLKLGRLVETLRDAGTAAQEGIGFEATARATADGTLVVGGEARQAKWVVDPAPADAITRTQLPDLDRDEPVTRAESQGKQASKVGVPAHAVPAHETPRSVITETERIPRTEDAADASTGPRTPSPGLSRGARRALGLLAVLALAGLLLWLFENAHS